jgi:cysteine-rich repeat protein
MSRFDASLIFLRRRSLRTTAAWVVSACALILASCAASQVKTETLCTPGRQVFCRCQDRGAGTKTCSSDGTSFSTCEPCESDENPEGPLLPGDPRGPYVPEPPVRPDGGTDGGDGGSTGASVCGDGTVQLNEDCDDKNAIELDGCSSTCKLSGSSTLASSACPGLEVHVWGGAHKPTLDTTTSGSGNRTVTPACGGGGDGGASPSTGSTAPDRVFRVVAHKTGTLDVVTSNADFSMLLYASATCDPGANTALGCANENASAGAESLSFKVEAGRTYHVFVDGHGTGIREGAFRISFQIR